MLNKGDTLKVVLKKQNEEIYKTFIGCILNKGTSYHYETFDSFKSVYLLDFFTRELLIVPESLNSDKVVIINSSNYTLKKEDDIYVYFYHTKILLHEKECNDRSLCNNFYTKGILYKDAIVTYIYEL